ncbi:MAG: NAD(P)-dependent oxidoreductase, partial [Allomuricauda sp.]
AESNQKLAEKVNVEGAKNLAEACSRAGAVMIHISTDFVFDGNQTNLYTEKDKENPLRVYNLTKLEGEREVAKALKEHFIIRTSWLYSEYGNNFVKTKLRLGSQRETLNVVCNQIGTPTYGVDFAKAIFEESETSVKLSPIKSEAYPTPAQRPKFSVMDKSKIKEEFKLEIPHWRDSLRECLSKSIVPRS